MRPGSFRIRPAYLPQYPTHYLGDTGWIHLILMDERLDVAAGHRLR